MKTVAVNMLMGAVFGFLLSRAGVADFNHVNGMFLLKDFHMYGVIGVAALVGFLGLKLVRGRRTLVGPACEVKRRERKPGNFIGGLLFGVGWAVTGACPGTSFVQLGGGHLSAAFTIVGILAGILSFRSLNDRFWHWPPDGCG